MKLNFIIYLILIGTLSGCIHKYNYPEKVFSDFPKETLEEMNDNEVWVFIMAGQSNMAGRGAVEPQDTVKHPDIFSINSENEIVYAKEPLHFYEPDLTGLDCGMSFSVTLLDRLPRPYADRIKILILPTAVGGSSIHQWLNNDEFRGVKLFSNFAEKVAIGKDFGTIKGILWHQGESDARPPYVLRYHEYLASLTNKFRAEVGDPELPIFVGELGQFPSDHRYNRSVLNEKLQLFVDETPSTYLTSSKGLTDKGDGTHFDSKSQRELGRRFANSYLKNVLNLWAYRTMQNQN